eukprot:gene277-288_t
MDQRAGLLEIQSTAGRDLRPSQIPNMILQLEEWQRICEQELQRLGESIEYAKSAKYREQQEVSDLFAEIEKKRREIKDEEGAHADDDSDEDGRDQPMRYPQH